LTGYGATAAVNNWLEPANKFLEKLENYLKKGIIF